MTTENTRPRKPDLAKVARGAAEQLAELIGKQPEAVTSVERTDDGWQVEIEVLELHRVPETSDVIGVYRVELDGNGRLAGYRRVGKTVRGQVREE